jgi:hypothetical protein
LLANLISPVFDISAEGFFSFNSTVVPSFLGATFSVTIPGTTDPGMYNLSIANWFTVGVSKSYWKVLA